MFTHLMVGSSDVARSKAFYDATFVALGIAAGHDAGNRVYYSNGGPAFGFGLPADGQAPCHANGGTIGFAATDMEAVDAWHAAGLAHGGTDEGGPGHRANAPGKAYGAYLRDPDGNKICAFCQMPA